MLTPSEHTALYKDMTGLAYPLSVPVVNYTYLGLGSFVQADYLEPRSVGT